MDSERVSLKDEPLKEDPGTAGASGSGCRMPVLHEATTKQHNRTSAQTHGAAKDLCSLLNDRSQPPAGVPATRTDAKQGPLDDSASRLKLNESNRARQARYRKNLKVPCSVFCVLGCSVLVRGLVPASK